MKCVCVWLWENVRFFSSFIDYQPRLFAAVCIITDLAVKLHHMLHKLETGAFQCIFRHTCFFFTVTTFHNVDTVVILDAHSICVHSGFWCFY